MNPQEPTVTAGASGCNSQDELRTIEPKVQGFVAPKSRRKMNAYFNKVRFDVLTGNDTLVIVDHKKGTMQWYKTERLDNLKAEGRDTRDYVENVLLTNGWRHMRAVEDSVNEASD